MTRATPWTWADLRGYRGPERHPGSVGRCAGRPLGPAQDHDRRGPYPRGARLPFRWPSTSTSSWCTASLSRWRPCPPPPLEGRPRPSDRGPRGPGGGQQRDQRDRDAGRPHRLPTAGLMVAALAGIIGRRSCSTPRRTSSHSGLLALMHVAPHRTRGAFGIGQLWRDVKEDLVPRPPGGAAGEHRGQHRAQVAIRFEVTCSLLYSESVLGTSVIGFPENYALLMASLGLGSIVGGSSSAGSPVRRRRDRWRSRASSGWASPSS